MDKCFKVIDGPVSLWYGCLCEGMTFRFFQDPMDFINRGFIMKKTGFSILIGMVFSFCAYATPPAWDQVAVLNYQEANTAAQVKKLMAKYPQYFESFKSLKVTSAFVGAWTVHYVGENTCGGSDPRLVQTSKSFGACYVEQGVTQCTQKNNLWPYDPCAQ